MAKKDDEISNCYLALSDVQSELTPYSTLPPPIDTAPTSSYCAEKEGEREISNFFVYKCDDPDTRIAATDIMGAQFFSSPSACGAPVVGDGHTIPWSPLEDEELAALMQMPFDLGTAAQLVPKGMWYACIARSCNNWQDFDYTGEYGKSTKEEICPNIEPTPSPTPVPPPPLSICCKDKNGDQAACVAGGCVYDDYPLNVSSFSSPNGIMLIRSDLNSVCSKLAPKHVMLNKLSLV